MPHAPSMTHYFQVARPRPEYILGLDLGQAAEYSALCVLERTEQANGDDKPLRRYGCRGLRRWPLGTGYPAICAGIAGLLKNPILRDCTLVLGATNVGRPVVEMFRQAKLPVTLRPVFITTGQDEHLTHLVHQVATLI